MKKKLDGSDMPQFIPKESLALLMSKLGTKGGNARAKALTAKRRKEIALNAINTRWKNNSRKQK